MSCFILLTFLVLSFQPGDSSGGAVAEISLIKNLLTSIFNRYKTDMASLQEVVELATGDLKR